MLRADLIVFFLFLLRDRTIDPSVYDTKSRTHTHVSNVQCLEVKNASSPGEGGGGLS